MGGYIGWFLGGFDGLLYTLVAFVIIDYITGVMVAILEKKLSSSIGFKGIFKKDIDKVFKFPRSLFSTLILPGLIIFIIYFIIGQVAASSIKKIQEHESRVCLIDVPDSFLEAAETAQEIQDFGKVIFSEEALDKEELKEERSGRES